MSKTAATNPILEVRSNKNDEWVDISDLTTQFHLHMVIGNLVVAELRLLYNREEISISYTDSNYVNYRVPTDDKITIAGVNVSDHIAAYFVESRCGETETLVLEYLCDEDTLRINGQAPWVRASTQV